MSMSLKHLFTVGCLFALVVSCGKNNRQEPVGPVQSAAPVSDFTDYDNNGNATNYQVCPDNPQQYCAQSCQLQSSFGTCSNQPQAQVNVVRITRVTVVLSIQQVITTPQNQPRARICNNDQIVYNRAGSCQGDNENVTLGSLMVSTPNRREVHIRWNNSGEAGVDHYRVIAHGKKNLSSSWVSSKIGCTATGCEVLLTQDSIGDATVFAGTKIPGPLDTLGVALGERVKLREQKVYWYEVVAYDGNGNVFRGHLNQPITRTFDFRQAACGGVIVAGFCSLN